MLGRRQQGSERGHKRGQLLCGNADSTISRLQGAQASDGTLRNPQPSTKASLITESSQRETQQ